MSGLGGMGGMGSISMMAAAGLLGGAGAGAGGGIGMDAMLLARRQSSSIVYGSALPALSRYGNSSSSSSTSIMMSSTGTGTGTGGMYGGVVTSAADMLLQPDEPGGVFKSAYVDPETGDIYEGG